MCAAFLRLADSSRTTGPWLSFSIRRGAGPKPNTDPSCSTSQKSLSYTSVAAGFVNPVLYHLPFTTVAVPSLVSDSSPPSSSVKVTCTLMTLPSSDAWSV